MLLSAGEGWGEGEMNIDDVWLALSLTLSRDLDNCFYLIPFAGEGCP